MTPSSRELILRAIVDALNSPDRPDGVPACERARALGASQPQLPMMVVYAVGETVQRNGRGPVSRRDLEFRVHCRAAGAFGDEVPADALTDEMIAWASNTLSGNRLGGLAHDIAETRVEWAIDAGDYAYVEATVDFVVTYQTTAIPGQ